MPSVTCYADRNKPYTVEVARAFAAGCGGGVAFDWRRRASDEVSVVVGMATEQQQLIKDSPDWMEIDYGYFKRGVFWRVTRNRLWADSSWLPDYDRFRKLGISVEKRNRGGGNILIALQSKQFYDRWAGQSLTGWEYSVRRALIGCNRPIVFRHKHLSRGQRSTVSIEAHLDRSWCVVVHSSAVALDALRRCIPISVTEPRYLAAGLSTPLERVSHPRVPSVEEVEALFGVAAANQWTLSEFRDGTAWRKLWDSVTN